MHDRTYLPRQTEKKNHVQPNNGCKQEAPYRSAVIGHHQKHHCNILFAERLGWLCVLFEPGQVGG